MSSVRKYGLTEENDYILSANTYNPYASEEETSHRDPKEILEEIVGLAKDTERVLKQLNNRLR